MHILSILFLPFKIMTNLLFQALGLKNKVIFAGSFNPLTKGHLNIIERLSEKYLDVYVVVGVNPKKNYLVPAETRKHIVEKAVSNLKNRHRIQVITHNDYIWKLADEFTVDRFAIGYINLLDLMYEICLSLVNLLVAGITTTFFKTDPLYSGISSTKVREKIKQNDTPESITDMVPENLCSTIFYNYKIE